MNAQDKETLKLVKMFNAYDLYSKADKAPDVDQLKPFYQELIDEFLPKTLNW